ncbi:MAG: glycosyltransferase [Chloroflexi bacterium]|nr:glycosyltransferase [Chloroflexota bacterium]
MALIAPPLISIITPVYNGDEYLEELIQSVLNQRYSNIEHLIIDDGSQDGGATVSILKRHPHLRWWSRENKGQYPTMNEGLLEAKGEIVCFVSADDLVTQDAVKLAFDFLNENAGLDGVFGITRFMDQTGNLLGYPVPFQKAPMSFVPYFAHIPHCSLYIKRDSLIKHGLLFDPFLKYVGDYEWMIRISKSGLNIGFINHELSRVRLHQNQTSQKNNKASLMEKQNVLKHHRINKLYYSLLWTLYLLRVWSWKAIEAFREDGVNGLVGLLARWYRYKTQ